MEIRETKEKPANKTQNELVKKQKTTPEKHQKKVSGVQKKRSSYAARKNKPGPVFKKNRRKVKIKHMKVILTMIFIH